MTLGKIRSQRPVKADSIQPSWNSEIALSMISLMFAGCGLDAGKRASVENYPQAGGRFPPLPRSFARTSGQFQRAGVVERSRWSDTFGGKRNGSERILDLLSHARVPPRAMAACF